jgi:hypothetical protein
MTMIRRDAFARQETHREAVGDGICDWCGSVGRLYQFRTETDGGRKHKHRGLFCCTSCHDAYHS